MVIKKIHDINLCNILSDAVCCMMCVDGKISESEKIAIHTVLKKAGVSWNKKETKARIEEILQIIKKHSLIHVIQETNEKIPFLKEMDGGDILLTSLKYVMYSDGKISDKEVGLFEQFKESLKQELPSKTIDEFKKKKIEEKKSSRIQNLKEKPLSTVQDEAKGPSQKEPCPYCGIRILFPVAECKHCNSKIEGSEKEYIRQEQLKELLLQKERLNNCSDSTYEKEYPKWKKAYVSWRIRGWPLRDRINHHWALGAIQGIVTWIVILGYIPFFVWLLAITDEYPKLNFLIIIIFFSGAALARKSIYSFLRNLR